MADDATGVARRRERCWDLVKRHYYDRGWRHAYNVFEDNVRSAVTPGSSVLDAGCGRTFPLAEMLLSIGAEACGVDAEVDATEVPAGATVHQGGLEDLPHADDTFDVVVARCLLEHLRSPDRTLAEFHRVLKPGGRVLFLAPNRYDYISLAASILPHRVRQWLVPRLEGRAEADHFRTYYRANTIRAIGRLSRRTGFAVEHVDYYNCYPAMFMNHPWLCRIGIAWDQLVTRVESLNWLQGWLMGSLRCSKAAPAQAVNPQGQAA